jgi:hypothetical protein
MSLNLKVFVIKLMFVFLSFNLYSSDFKLFNWWNYIAPEVLEEAKNKGFNVNLIVYKNEELAITRLMHNKDNFDLAILSNTAIEPLLKSNKLIKNAFKDVVSSHKYFDFMKKTSSHCLPFLWTVTTFTYDPRYTNIKLDNIFKMEKLKNEGYKIGVVDDLFEFTARVILDSGFVCRIKNEKINRKKVIKTLELCTKDEFLKAPKALLPSDFINRVKDFSSASKVAVYGWHGAAKSLHRREKSLEYVLPDNDVVVSYDSICIVKNKNKNKKNKLKELKRLALLLGDKNSSDLNAKYTQSFSSFVDASPDVLEPKIKKLFSNIQLNIDKLDFVIVNNLPDEKTHARLNNWWRSIRYEK